MRGVQKMYTKRIHALADHIETLSYGEEAGKFNMEGYIHECGSPACIAGWACFMFEDMEIGSNVLHRECDGYPLTDGYFVEKTA